MRHGRPVRLEPTGEGPADPPLTPEGREQAERAAAWLAREPVDHIVTSPSRRARETAAPLAERLGRDPEVVQAVSEFDARADGYIPFEQLREASEEHWRAMVSGSWRGIDGWDEPDAFRARVVEGLEAVIARFPGQRVVTFTHAGTTNAFLGHVLGIERLLWFYPGYASISRVVAARTGERSIVSVNETAHLDAVGA